MTHDISSMLAENDPCMWGRATLVMLVSSTCITVTSITEKVMAHLCVEPRGASGSPRGHVAGSVAEFPGAILPGPRLRRAGRRRGCAYYLGERKAWKGLQPMALA